jgi:FMN reductase
MSTVTIVVGNPHANSRTRQVAEVLVEKLLVPGSYDLQVIDLADHTSELFDWSSKSVTTLTERVAQSDLIVVASPTYKASYTGLLKAFLDRYATNGLRGVIAIPVMTGGDLTHALAPDTHLAPLLVELGASVPVRGLYFVASQIDEVEQIVQAAAAEYSATFTALGAFASTVTAFPADPTT